MTGAAHILDVRCETQKVGQGILLYQHDHIPLFIYRPDKVITAFAQKYYIATRCLEKRQRMVDILPERLPPGDLEI